MIRFAICDDESHFLDFFQKKLREHLESLKIDHKITCYDNGQAFLKDIADYDAVFLDLHMPEMSGLEVAKYINENHPIPVLFLSAHSEWAYATVQFQPFRFIRKTFIDIELDEALCALNRYMDMQAQHHFVSFRTASADIRMCVRNIKYAEIYDHFIHVHTIEEEEFTGYGKLSDYEKQWEEYGFIRTHKSYLVNGWYIDSIQENTVVLKGGEKVLLSRRREAAVNERLRALRS